MSGLNWKRVSKENRMMRWGKEDYEGRTYDPIPLPDYTSRPNTSSIPSSKENKVSSKAETVSSKTKKVYSKAEKMTKCPQCKQFVKKSRLNKHMINKCVKKSNIVESELKLSTSTTPSSSQKSKPSSEKNSLSQVEKVKPSENRVVHLEETTNEFGSITLTKLPPGKIIRITLRYDT